MPTPVPPVKTPLGLEEMRTRSHGLNQRHRTVLFLVDGRRTLSEVLALAVQAGSSTTHFEDLVRLGLVQVAIEREVPDAAPSPSSGVDSGAGVTISGVLAVDLDPPAAPIADAPPPVRPITLRPVPVVMAPRPAIPVDTTSEAVLSAEQQREQAKVAAEALYEQVRELLIETLRIDAPLFAAITLMRVHRARSSKDLINLVWEIERHLGVSRKRQRELQSLHRARELLGMGNTQIGVDSEIGFPDTQ